MFLVTGGETVSDTLGSTEIYDPEIGSWSEVPPLPSPRSSLRAASLGNRVLIFGIDIYCKHKVSKVYTFDNNCKYLQVVMTEVMLSTVFWSMASWMTPTHR